jgi:hypothetical protein
VKHGKKFEGELATGISVEVPLLSGGDEKALERQLDALAQNVHDKMAAKMPLLLQHYGLPVPEDGRDLVAVMPFLAIRLARDFVPGFQLTIESEGREVGRPRSRSRGNNLEFMSIMIEMIRRICGAKTDAEACEILAVCEDPELKRAAGDRKARARTIANQISKFRTITPPANRRLMVSVTTAEQINTLYALLERRALTLKPKSSAPIH